MTDTNTAIVIGCDHAAYELKEKLKAYMLRRGESVEDIGPHSAESVDYPDDVRIAYRYFPFTTIFDKGELAARAAACTDRMLCAGLRAATHQLVLITTVPAAHIGAVAHAVAFFRRADALRPRTTDVVNGS